MLNCEFVAHRVGVLNHAGHSKSLLQVVGQTVDQTLETLGKAQAVLD